MTIDEMAPVLDGHSYNNKIQDPEFRMRDKLLLYSTLKQGVLSLTKFDNMIKYR